MESFLFEKSQLKYIHIKTIKFSKKRRNRDMAKYITKENLPVFKYVNPVSTDFYEEAQNDLNTMLVYYKNIQDSLRQDKPEIFSEEEKVHMINLILKCRKYYPQSFFADGPGQQGILSKIKERVDAIDLANTQFIGEDIRIILGLCIRMLNIMTFTPILQGKVFDQSEVTKHVVMK